MNNNNIVNKLYSKYRTISNGVNLKQKNKKSKSFILSWEGMFFLFILFWVALLFKNVFNSNTAISFTVLWFQFFYILWHICVLMFLVFISWGLGRKLSKVLQIPYSSILEEFPFAVSLGLGIISLITLTIGAVKLFYPIAIYAVTFILFILTIKELREITREIYNRWEKRDTFKLDIAQVLLFCLIGITALILLMGTFTPPLSYDGLAYHLGVPKTYIKSHGIISLPYHVYSNFPFNMEMLYAYSILLTGNEILAKMFHFLTTLLICFSLYAFGKKYFNHKIGLLSAAIFINIPLVGQLSMLCYNDLGLALFIFLSIFAFINWVSSPEKEKPNWLVLCGILTGLALGIKYFAIIFLFIFLSLAIIIKSAFITTSKSKISRITKNLAIFIGLSFCTFLPWMVKNLIITGNPVFPFLYPIFKEGNWTMSHYQKFLDVHLAYIFTFKEFFSQLWILLANSAFGLSFILILPFIFFLKKIPAHLDQQKSHLLQNGQTGGDIKIKFFGVYATYYYLTWFFFTHRVDRFILPLYVFLSLIVAYTLFRLPEKLRALAGSFLGLFLAFNLLILVATSGNIGFTEAFSGLKNKEEYLEEKLYYYPAIKYINNELPSLSKILFIGDNQTYYCEKPLLSNSPLDKSIIVEIVRSSKNYEEIKNKLRVMGITHIYYNASEVKRTQETYSAFDWKDKEEYTFNNFIGNYTKTLFEKNGCFIFEIINEK